MSSLNRTQTIAGFLLGLFLLAAMRAHGGNDARPPQDAQAILESIRQAGGYEAIAERLEPWRRKVAGRIAAIPPAKHTGYVADDAPLDGKGILLSGRRAKQLVYESDLSGKDDIGDRRYRLAEEALVHAHHQFAALGIRLLVVPAPDKCDIFPERIAPLPDNVPTVHLRSKQLYLRLLHAGVEVVDCEALLRSRKGKESGPLYMLRDTHWSPAGSRLVAHAVAGRLADWTLGDDSFVERGNQVHSWDGDLAENWARAGNKRFPKERHKFIGVARANGKPITTSADSPVLVMGDSYSTYPYNGFFSFWAFLSQALGRRVGFTDQAGGGNAVLRKFNRIPKKTREQVKVVVLLFTSCSFYEVDFRKIDLLKQPVSAMPLVKVRVTLEQQPVEINPKTARYADAIAGLRARVDRGDGFPVAMQVYVPVLQKRRLLPAAKWKTGQTLVLDLHPEEPKGFGGIMVLEQDPDAALPAAYVHHPGFPDKR